MGRPDQYMFDPDLQVDKLITSSQFVMEKREKKDVMEPIQQVQKELGQRSMRPPTDDMIEVKKIRYKGVEYLLKPRSDGLTFDMYDSMDTKFRKLKGEITINPVTGTFKGSKPIMVA
jgi:hypothetical protein